MLWSLALHSLRHRLLRTSLTALGIAVAVASTVIFLSLGEGLRQVLGQELGNYGPDLQVSFGPFDAASSFTSLPELPLEYLDDLRSAGARYGIRSVTPLLIHFRGGLSVANAFVFQGAPADVDPAELFGGFELLQGRGLTPADEGEPVAVIGEKLAERSSVGLGSTLRFNPEHSVEIVGVATSDAGLLDNAVLLPLTTLQEALGIHDRVNFFAIDLEESSRAAEVAAELERDYPDLGFQTRGELLRVVEQGIRISDVIRLGISVIALVVGAIAVANTMLMSVFERTREFGVVRSVGARPRFLFGLVLAESVLLSIAGAAAGLVIGRLGIAAVNSVADELIGLAVALLTPRLALFAVAIAIVVGLLAGLAPAARAARIPIATAMARE